ncbi:RHS repeat-associated core domain-containing protein [Pseudomonas sp. RIT-PI-S]|uniref:RHS repeat-associated core domain-containing protein n=1 Tax=Pseudomonas sp. RIT-PI-S TaxID=3035295 RepID=UPI0021DB3AA9|nr:RHS repeat-associated core domain-containing protein [Pseudomonas sp. RIT-PI-S]
MKRLNMVLPKQALPGASHHALLKTDGNATVIGQVQPHRSMAYMPFGHSLSHEGASAFGGEHRADGIYMLGNGRRAYLCSLMRFAMPDRLGPFRSPDRHTYAYCLADPINRLDRNGDYSFWKIARRMWRSISHSSPSAAETRPPVTSTAKFVSTPITKITRLGKEAFAWKNDQGLHLLAHGNRKGVGIRGKLRSPSFLVKEIQDRIDGQFSALHLYSCKAGIGNPSYLQRLANKLKRPVYGSSNIVFTFPAPGYLEEIYSDLRLDGKVINESFDLPGWKLSYSAENWKLFSPK